MRTWMFAPLTLLIVGRLHAAPLVEPPDEPDLEFVFKPNAYAVPIGPFTIYDSHCRSAKAWSVAEHWGIGQAALLTQHRFYDPATDDIDLDLYVEQIWTPGARPECSMHLDGVPPGFTGPIWLDYEQWDEFRNPDNYTDQAIISRFFQYYQLIEATRILRPDSPIILHNMLRTAAHGHPLVYALEAMLHLRVHATSPALWVQCPSVVGDGIPSVDLVETPDNCMSFEDSWNVYTQLLRLALEVKAETGLKVYPAVWYRYKLLGDPVPAWLMRIHLARILNFRWAEQHVDGVVILGGGGPTDDAMIDHMVLTADITTQVVADMPAATH